MIDETQIKQSAENENTRQDTTGAVVKLDGAPRGQTRGARHKTPILLVFSFRWNGQASANKGDGGRGCS